MTEQRLIDANALEEHIADNYGYPAVDILHEIATFPTIDAVPVVRCNDCKYFGYNIRHDTYCGNISGLTHPEKYDSCSYGERKDDGA